MVVVVINVYGTTLNVYLVYEKRFRGPLAFGGPRQSPTFTPGADLVNWGPQAKIGMGPIHLHTLI